jgi:acetyltransferase-like isoleucine patch superfamily enzyme
MFRKLYFSSFGYLISGILHLFSWVHKPFMVYGYRNRKTGNFYKRTRISSSAKLINRKNIDLSDNIWIGHYCLVDGTGGVIIEEGVQLSSHTVVYSHSSQDSIRLLGKHFMEWPARKRPGYKLKPVTIGSYTFVGTSSVILPGSVIGKGCIIGAGSVVNGKIPDYAIAVGNPVKIVGDTRVRDKKYFGNQWNTKEYYNPEIILSQKENKTDSDNKE